MKRYISLYRHLILMNFSKLVVYRVNFISSLTSSLVWGVFIIIQMFLLTAKSTSFYGWSRDELLLLTGIFSIGVGIFHIVLTPNFENIAAVIEFGRLDVWLLKPLDSQFLASFTYINFGAVTRLLAAVGFTLFTIVQVQLRLTFVSISVFLLLFCIGMVLIYSIWMSVVTLLIWAPRLSNIVEFMFSYMGMGRFPREMFAKSSRLIFFAFLPITFVAISPARVLLAKAGLPEISGLLIFTAVFFFGSRKFWQFALRYYTSASS